MKSDTLHSVVQTGYIIHAQTSFLDYTTVPQTWAHLITGLGLTSCTFPPFISSKTYQVLLEVPGMHGLGPSHRRHREQNWSRSRQYREKASGSGIPVTEVGSSATQPPPTRAEHRSLPAACAATTPRPWWRSWRRYGNGIPEEMPWMLSLVGRQTGPP